MGSARPFRPEIHRLRPHPGQMESAARIARLIEGSEIEASHSEDFTHAVQDAYSLRCAPQVHGAAMDTLRHVRRVVDIELGAVVDNPIVFPESGDVLSAGNFHGQPLAFAADFLTIAATELGSISERRTDRILDPERSSGLPPFLSVRPGLNSRLHAGAVHRRLPGRREPGAVPPGFGGVDSDIGIPRGPRLDGLGCGPQDGRGARQHRPGPRRRDGARRPRGGVPRLLRPAPGTARAVEIIRRPSLRSPTTDR